ncbi:MAG: 6-carboxytetrahydropterin synthase [Pseudomonadota bacterium]|nr:6-carboxytetrahydropterin synthase [Pseudomonadota bacterium]
MLSPCSRSRVIDSRIFIKNLDCIDSAIFNEQLGVFGVSWLVHLTAIGTVDDNYFVYDFRKLKQEIRRYLHEHIDHRLLLPTNPYVRYHQNRWQLHSEQGVWEYTCPATAVCQLPLTIINIETVATILQTRIQQHLKHLPRLQVSLTTDQLTAGQKFHYTHGLPGHDGNCQRLLHGHQGFLQVYTDSQRQPQLEQHLITKVLKHYVHFANSLHTKHNSTSIEVCYESKQGYFSAKLPRQQCLVLPEQETSIESISQYLATYLRNNYNLQQPTRIICYEGFNKGAEVALLHN